MCNKPLVLVVAQSGRFIAQSVAKAGYPVSVIDCFGDVDTLSLTQSHILLPDLSDHDALKQAILSLCHKQSCVLVYGSGFELFIPVLKALPDYIEIVGNNTNALETIHSAAFFSLLQQCNIAHPETQFNPPSQQQNWISKSFFGFGGSHIRSFNSVLPHNDPAYYQRYQEGKVVSALFLADKRHSSLLSLNLNHTRGHEEGELLFLSQGLTSPTSVSPQQLLQITGAIEKLVVSLKLAGLNSLDFIIDQSGDALLIDLNPRISASAQLLFPDLNIFQLHFDSYSQHRATTHPIAKAQRHLHIVYASENLCFPEGVLWPDYCGDLPQPGVTIMEGDPVCTAVVETTRPFDLSQKRLEETIKCLSIST